VRRRAFLRGLAASLAALPLAPLAIGAGGCDDGPPPVPLSGYDEILAAYFGDAGLDDAAVIGDRYLRQLGDGTAEALQPTRELLDSQPDAAAAVTALEAAVAEEFAADAWRDLDGWILSPTELSLCALVRGAPV
jgi:hypothetical protein